MRRRIVVLGSVRPSWVAAGAIIDEDFYNNRSWPRPFTSELADTRSSDQWVTTRAGLLVQKTATVLSISDAGLLIEGARTNECLQSNTFSNATWLKTTSGTGVAPVVTANFATSPDGTSNATRIQLDLGATPATAVSRLFQGSLDALNVQRARSIWLKTNDASTKTLYWVGADTNTQMLTVTGTWQRFTAADTSSVISAYAQMQFGLDGSASTSNTADILVYGAQLEQGASVSSYIPTTTASVTRAANAVTIQRTGIGRVVFTFDDDSQQTVSGINTATQYTLSTTLNRPLIKRMTGYAS